MLLMRGEVTQTVGSMQSTSPSCDIGPVVDHRQIQSGPQSRAAIRPALWSTRTDDLHPFVPLVKGGQGARQDGAGVFIRDADADRPDQRAFAQRDGGLVQRRDDAAGIGQQLLAPRRQRHAAGKAVEQGLAQTVFQPLDLQRHGRLRAEEPRLRRR